MSVVIEATNISKRFYRGERNQRAFFEDVAAKVRGLVQRRPIQISEGNARRGWFWALKDVSFQVSQGQTLAIIGDNGAGKSTLLKILSRITQPASGVVKVYGRLASLLEVGTGFHPEFSGRDNIYLNGAMLGLSRREVGARFDQIVDFSGLEAFLDVPVKNYSSGMYIRLAFSVAAHLNPEIVILDEVLAVGDAVFQKKCFDRMEEIIGEGHAAILVSHSLPYVRKMSETCIWLDHGQVRRIGPTDEVANEYEALTSAQVAAIRQKHEADIVSGPEAHSAVRLLNWRLESPVALGPNVLTSGMGEVEFWFELQFAHPITNPRILVTISDPQGSVLISCSAGPLDSLDGRVKLRLAIAAFPVRPGGYGLTCQVGGDDFTPIRLHASPELTVRPALGREASEFHGALNIPAELAVHELAATLL
jgi:ABC-type polysaccharide/polyol phosphate transport system ATPase subunit